MTSRRATSTYSTWRHFSGQGNTEPSDTEKPPVSTCPVWKSTYIRPSPFFCNLIAGSRAKAPSSPFLDFNPGPLVQHIRFFWCSSRLSPWTSTVSYLY
ncbi:uncharacterized protein LOC135377754 isoform X2 [Ornithodoros turicata]